MSNTVAVLTQDMSTTDLYCVVDTTEGFPDKGYAVIGAEIVYYTTLSPNRLSGLSRGQAGSLIKAHPSGSYVVQDELKSPINKIFERLFEEIGTDLYLDDDGDMEITDNGDIRFASGLEALAVRLRLRILSILGFGLNQNVGIDMPSNIFRPKNLVGKCIESMQQDPAVGRVEAVSWKVDDDGMLFVRFNVFPAGFNDSFEFIYRINYRERGV